MSWLAPAGWWGDFIQSMIRRCVFPIVLFAVIRGGSMSGYTIYQRARSHTVRQRLFVKFFVTPVVFYACWCASTLAVDLRPDEINGLGWRSLSSLAAAGLAASFAVTFVQRKN